MAEVLCPLCDKKSTLELIRLVNTNAHIVRVFLSMNLNQQDLIILTNTSKISKLA